MPVIDEVLAPLSYDGVLDCSRELPKTYPRVPLTVLAVSGDVDACTGGRLIRDLRCCVAIGRPTIVDLSMLDFFGARGLSILIDFDRQCRANGLPWVTVTCPMVDRMAGLTGTTRVLGSVRSLRAARWRLRGVLLGRGRRRAPLAPRAALRC